MDKVRMFCSKDCPDTCEFNAWLEDGDLRVEPVGWSFLKKPFVCKKLKGFFKREVLDNRASSMINGKQVDTYRAIAEFAEFLKSSNNKKILYYRGSGNLGYAMFGWDYVLSRIDSVYFVDGSPCDETGIEAHIDDFGVCVNPDVENLQKADVIVIFGRNAFVVSPHLYVYLKQLNKKVVYIDPIKTATAKLGKYIRINPAADGNLAYALIDALGVDHLSGSEDAFLETGIKYEEFEYLVDLFKLKKVAIIEGYGLQRYKNGKNSIQWINRLAYMTDNVDVLYYSRSSKEGLKKPEIKPRRRVFISDVSTLLKDGFFDAIIVVASNPVISLPDSDVWLEALKNRFSVCVDTNLTETSRLANIFIKVDGMFAQEDVQGSYFFNKTLKKEALIDGVNDLLASKELSKLLSLDFNVALPNEIVPKVKPERNPRFNRISLSKPYNENGRVRLLSVANEDYLNSQVKIKEDETIYLSFELAEGLGVSNGDRVFIKHGNKKEQFNVLKSEIVKGNVAVVYKSRSLKTNRIYSTVPTDTKRGIAYNDTFIEIKKIDG